jgi:hypothetical protein
LGKEDKGGFEIPLNLPSGKGEVKSLLFYCLLLPLFLFLFLLLGFLDVFSAFTAHFCASQ